MTTAADVQVGDCISFRRGPAGDRNGLPVGPCVVNLIWTSRSGELVFTTDRPWLPTDPAPTQFWFAPSDPVTIHTD